MAMMMMMMIMMTVMKTRTITPSVIPTITPGFRFILAGVNREMLENSIHEYYIIRKNEAVS